MLYFNCRSNPTPLLRVQHQIILRNSPFQTRRAAAPHTSEMDSSGVGTPLTHIQGTIYLDYNATTPIFPEVSAAMLPFVTTHFGNPSSSHPYGRATRAALDRGRQQVATLLNAASPSEIYFTSCGTESDNWAIFGAISAFRRRHPGITAPPHVVSSSIEHPAILEALHAYHALGLLDFTLVGVDAAGLVNVSDVEAAIIPGRTALVTIMHSNNEVGTLQPIAGIARAAKAKGVVVHTDAAQSVGKVAVDVVALGVDAVTVVGHKFGAPKGVAALYIREGVEIDRFLCGGGQEGGRRAGTENALLIAGMGAAAEVATRELLQTAAHMAALRDALQARLLEGLSEGAVVINGPEDPKLRLPNTLSVSFPGVVASQLLGRLNEELAASAGAACHSVDAMKISSVLEAMKMPYERAVGTVRLSVGRHTTLEDVVRGVELILKEVKRDI